MQFAYSNGNFLNAEAILRGPQYFLLMQTTHKKNNTDSGFFNSFGFDNIQYVSPTVYIDTICLILPSKDSGTANHWIPSLANLMYQIMHRWKLFVAQLQHTIVYWPKNQYAMFKSDSTGESVLVGLFEYPKYYYSKDSAVFWKKQLDLNNTDAFVYSQVAYKPCDSCQGYKIYLRDTNTVRQVINYKILKNNRLYNLYTITDTINHESSFIKDFFQTFTPLNKTSSSVYSV